MVHQVTTNDNEWQWVVQRVTTSGTTSDNEWYEWQRVATCDTTSDNDWQQMAMSNSEWQQWYNDWNGIAHFIEWMIAILSMTKTDALLLQGMDGCN